MQDLFGRFGPVVSCRVIMDHDSGRSKGYGFVTMGSAGAASAAVAGLDGQQLPGATKAMSVKIADSNRQGAGRGAGAPFQQGDSSYSAHFRLLPLACQGSQAMQDEGNRPSYLT